MIKVFVSSTYEDLKLYRDRARRLIIALGYRDIAMETWGANPRPPKDVVTAAIRNCDIYVGIVAWRYGSRVESEDVSYTEYEYRIARDCGIPRLLFLMHPDHPWPHSWDEDGRANDQVRAFRREVQHELSATFFKTEWDFIFRLCATLSEIVSHSGQYLQFPREERAILELLRLTQEDFIARRNEIETQREDSRIEAPGSAASRQWLIRHSPAAI